MFISTAELEYMSKNYLWPLLGGLHSIYLNDTGLPGYGIRSDGWAPSTYAEICDTYLDCQANGTAYPVSPDGLAGSVWITEEDNACFRFLHDMVHLKLDKGFSMQGETAVAKYQATEFYDLAIDSGYPVDLACFAYDVVWHEVYSQRRFYEKRKDYVNNQKEFIVWCLAGGLPEDWNNE